jgi:hypothetical protein
VAIRGVEERIRWFDSHRPDAVGRCAEYTHESFGGLPLWHTPDANAVVRKAREAGVLHTSDNPPRGAIVLWTSPTHGHMCLSLGNRRIISTDYPRARDTGEAPITMPRTKWGHSYAGWLDSYAGVTFRVGSDAPNGVHLSLLRYGNSGPDVKELQRALNKHYPAADIPETGNYLGITDSYVRRCQQEHGFGHDPAGKSFVGRQQAEHLGLVAR